MLLLAVAIVAATCCVAVDTSDSEAPAVSSLLQQSAPRNVAPMIPERQRGDAVVPARELDAAVGPVAGTLYADGSCTSPFATFSGVNSGDSKSAGSAWVKMWCAGDDINIQVYTTSSCTTPVSSSSPISGRFALH